MIKWNWISQITNNSEKINNDDNKIKSRDKTEDVTVNMRDLSIYLKYKQPPLNFKIKWESSSIIY